MSEATVHRNAKRWRNVPTFFPPLLSALQFRNPQIEALQSLNTTEWEELLSFSDLAHLTLLLSELSSDVLPSWAMSRIQTNVRDNTKRIERIKDAYREIALALDKEQVDYLLIKGFTQYPEFVKKTNLRMQSDFDIYIPQEGIFRGRDALLGLGYKERDLPPNVPVDHLPTLVRKGSWQWNGNHFDPEMPPSVEIHFCLWNEEAARFAVKECDDFWGRRVRRSVDGLDFTALHPADHIAFLSFHILRGLLRTDWVIHHVYELAYFLHTHVEDRSLWTSWRQLHSESTRDLQAISFALAKTWFNCDVGVEAEEQISKLSPAVQQWLLRFSDSPFEWMFTPNHDSVWLHMSLVESFNLKIGIVRAALLPNRIPSLKVPDSLGSRNRRAEERSGFKSIQYLSYVADRLRHYSYSFYRGVWRGAGWWFAKR